MARFHFHLLFILYNYRPVQYRVVNLELFFVRIRTIYVLVYHMCVKEYSPVVYHMCVREYSPDAFFVREYKMHCVLSCVHT